MSEQLYTKYAHSQMTEAIVEIINRFEEQTECLVQKIEIRRESGTTLEGKRRDEIYGLYMPIHPKK
jgi:hypothetical protein